MSCDRKRKEGKYVGANLTSLEIELLEKHNEAGHGNSSNPIKQLY